MSNSSSKSKLIKRHASDDSDEPCKRQRIVLNSSRKRSIFTEKCSTTSKLNILRDRDKKIKNSGTLNPLDDVGENIPSQSRVKTLLTQGHFDKTRDVRDKRLIFKRSKKRSGKFILKDDSGEETIIEIDNDNSSQPSATRRSDDSIKRMGSLPTPRRKKLIGEDRLSGDSFRLSKSLVTVSEVTGSEKSFKSSTPLQQRLTRIRKAPSSSSSTKTPNSNETIQSLQRKETLSGSPPKGLKIPLKRNLVKRSFEEFKSSSSSSINSKDESLNNSEESVVLKDPLESSGILKRIASTSPKTLVVKRSKSSHNTEDTKVPALQHKIIHIKECKTLEQPALFKFTESFASKRFNKLRDSLKNTESEGETKHVSPLKRTLEVKSTDHIAKTEKPVERQHHNFIPNLFRNNNKSVPNAGSAAHQSPEPKFNIILPSSSVSNRLKLIKEKQRRSLEEGQASPKLVFGRNSYDNAESTEGTNNIFMRKCDEGPKQNKEGKIFKKEPYGATDVRNTYQKRSSLLQNRLLRITTSKGGNSENRFLVKKSSSTMDIDLSQENQPRALDISEREGPIASTSKSIYIENWMETVNPPARASDAYQSDSLLVNVDDSFLNKSELMTEQQEDVSMEWDVISEGLEMKQTAEPSKLETEKEQFIYIVTDTNVFLHDLSKIRELLALSTSGKHKLKIFIPWMVQQEIDNFKDSCSSNLRPMALAAQKLINGQLMQPDAKVIGQSITDVCDQVDLGKAPDDKILACLLQAGKKYESVILLSNDIGLRNKAISNNFKAYSPKEVLAMIRNSKCLRIKIRLQNFLSQVIFHCCKNAFGDLCTKMEVLQGCPWPFEECLRRFKRHWSSAFQQLLLKHCYKCVDELLCLCSQGDIFDSDRAKLTKFKNKVKEFLFYIQDIEHFNATAKKMRDEVDNIFNSGGAM